MWSQLVVSLLFSADVGMKAHDQVKTVQMEEAEMSRCMEAKECEAVWDSTSNVWLIKRKG